MNTIKTSRNHACPCKSGKKYKHCCADRAVAAGTDQQKNEPALSTVLQDALRAHQAGRFDDAAAHYDDLIAAQPAHADALHLRGVLELQAGRHDAATVLIQAAIRVNPNDALYYYHLGTALLEAGRFDEAAAALREALARRPGHAETFGNLATALSGMGDFAGAAASFSQALALKPGDAATCCNLGLTLHQQGDTDAAVATLLQAIAFDAGHAPSYLNLGFILRSTGRLDESIPYLEHAIALNPGYAKAYCNLGEARQAQSRPAEAIASYRRALELQPFYSEAFSNLLLSLLYAACHGPDQVFAEHLQFAARFQAPHEADWPQHRNPKQPERRLKIGYLSGDLRDHAVAHFIEPVLAHHDRPRFKIHCYYNHFQDDAVTRRLKERVDCWVPCKALNDAQLAARIAADGIDILIDLSGHTAHNRLPVLARKPAPVQVSWIGYPGTTGLSAIDYYIADRFFLPPGLLDAQFAERIVRLPVGAPFLPYPGSPAVSPLPALRRGHLTFGSFNQVGKLNGAVIRLWSTLLRAVPDARLLLAALPHNERDAELIDLFGREGISRERLMLHPRTDTATYLALHDQVDVCLDTFPYTGGTTTLHAAWMGVPTLTIAGGSAAGRQGCIAPGHLGIEEFIAVDQADFVTRGAGWAGNLDALATIRSTMRDRFLQSGIVRPDLITRSLEAALRTMWHAWCAGEPVRSFDVGIDLAAITDP